MITITCSACGNEFYLSDVDYRSRCRTSTSGRLFCNSSCSARGRLVSPEAGVEQVGVIRLERPGRELADTERILKSYGWKTVGKEVVYMGKEGT